MVPLCAQGVTVPNMKYYHHLAGLLLPPLVDLHCLEAVIIWVSEEDGGTAAFALGEFDTCTGNDASFDVYSIFRAAGTLSTAWVASVKS